MSKLVAILLAGIAVFLPFVGEQVDSGDFYFTKENPMKKCVKSCING